MNVGLAIQLIGLLPGAVDGILKIVNTIKEHPETPEDQKKQLEDISLLLQVTVNRVKAVELPPVGSGR